mgnify:CR=1 FL=1
MEMMPPEMMSRVLCFVDGTQTILHPPQIPRGACPACESGKDKEILEGGIVMHKLPGGFILPMPPDLDLDEYVVFLRDHLLRMDDTMPSSAIQFTTATFCEFTEDPDYRLTLEAGGEDTCGYTPNEEMFPLNPDGQVVIAINNYMLTGWLTHIFTYDFEDEEVALEE